LTARRSKHPSWWGLAIALTLSTGTQLAGAVETVGVDAPVSSPPATGGTEQAVVGRYWELGRTRPFLATTVDAGLIYLRPRVMAGYGRPHWSWIGVEADPSLGVGGVGYYSGIAATLPWLSLRVGGRYFYPFSRNLLEPREEYERSDIGLLGGPVGDYLAYEAEAAGTLPLGPGSAFAVATGMHLSLVPPDKYVFEDSLKVVAAPPWLWRARVGYLLALGFNGALRIGAAGETIGLPGRDAFVIRAGLVASVLISSKLEAQASLLPVLASPDSLGLAGSDFGTLGVRYRWGSDSTPDPKRLQEAVEAEKQRR